MAHDVHTDPDAGLDADLDRVHAAMAELQGLAGDGDAVAVDDTLEAARSALDQLQRTAVAMADQLAMLRDLDRWKAAFLSTARHDLRTPLSIIATTCETLEEHPELPADQARQLTGRARVQVRRLEAMLQDLLDLDAFAHDVVAGGRRLADVGVVVQQAVAEVGSTTHPIRLEVPPVTALVDVRNLARVVRTLVRTATTHTPAGTPVDVHLAAGAARLTLVVEHEDPGPAEEARDQLVAPFVGRTAGGPEVGPGAGLTLVRAFAELHGGNARVDDGPAGGTRFVLELPRT